MELGSNFDLDVNNLYLKPNNVVNYISDKKSVWFNYGRSAIKSIKISQDKKVLLPEFICESVLNCFQHDRVIFFKIKDDFSIDFDDLLSKIDKTVGTIYICHYFGYLQDKVLLESCRQVANELGVIIIEDTTQSFFSVQDLIGDVAVSSIRKWLPVPQGAVLYMRGSNVYGDNLIDIPHLGSIDNTSVTGMILKNLFLNKTYDTNKMYREIFTNCEELVDTQSQLEGMSEFATFIAKCIDVDLLVKRRKDNAGRLKRYLDSMGIKAKKFAADECPLVYPIRVRNRDNFRSYLMDNNVYCAVHWPFDGFQPEKRSMGKRNAEELISLPIDQRYGSREIDYLCEVIGKYKAEL